MQERRGVRGPKTHVSKSIDKAEFFKIFLPDRCSQRIQISPAYLKRFNKTVRERIMLKDSYGKKWLIGTEKVGGAVYFSNGWPEFVRHYDLKYADMLIFSYDQCFCFKVRVFGTNGCRKEPPSTDVVEVKSEPESE